MKRSQEGRNFRKGLYIRSALGITCRCCSFISTSFLRLISFEAILIQKRIGGSDAITAATAIDGSKTGRKPCSIGANTFSSSAPVTCVFVGNRPLLKFLYSSLGQAESFPAPILYVYNCGNRVHLHDWFIVCLSNG